MKTGNWVLWDGQRFQILVELDDEYVYLCTGEDSAALVHVSELQIVQ